MAVRGALGLSHQGRLKSLGAGVDAWFARSVSRQPEQPSAGPGEAQPALESCGAEPDGPGSAQSARDTTDGAADSSSAGGQGAGLPEDYGADRPRHVGLPAPLVVGLLVTGAVLMWYAIYWLITRQA